MAVIRKDILYPGKWLTPAGWEDFSPERVKANHDRIKEWLALKVNIPVCWEHQSKAVPLSADDARGERAKYTFGHIADVSMEGETLVAELEVPDVADAKRLPAVRFVSPALRSNVKVGNREWPGESIVHLAATPKPVQWLQQPFGEVRLSLDGYTALGTDPPDPGQKPKVKKRSDTDDSDGSGPADGAEDAESGDSAPGKSGDKPGSDKDAPRGKSPSDPNQVGRADQVMQDQIGRICDLFAKLGMPLPDGTNKDNAYDRFETALRVKQAQDNPGKPYGEEQVGETEMNPAPVGLSAEDQARFTRAEKRLLKAEKLGLQRRINALMHSGRITKATHQKLSEQLTTVQLSLDDSGELSPNRLLDRIEIYEELFAGASDPHGTMRFADDGEEVELSAEQLGGPQTQAEVNAAVKAFFEASGKSNGDDVPK